MGELSFNDNVNFQEYIIDKVNRIKNNKLILEKMKEIDKFKDIMNKIIKYIYSYNKTNMSYDKYYFYKTKIYKL